jgi:AraC family transcriptional activator FtrA
MPMARNHCGKHVVAVIVLPGTVALELAIAVQAFGERPAVFAKIRDEGERPYELMLCGASLSPGLAAGTKVRVEPWSSAAAAHTVIVPGIEDPLTSQDPVALRAIAAAADRGARLVSLCGGAFVLGQAGVLDGRSVTTHWALAEEFRSAFPTTKLRDEQLYVEDGQVFSSGGMLAAVDLCLHVLRRDLGQAYANDVSRLLVSPPHRSGGQAQYRVARRARHEGSLASTLDWMLAHLDQELTSRTMSAHVKQSPRTLARRFRHETGKSLLAWVTEHRVLRARGLLEETDLTVAAVARTVGFGSVESFRRQFFRYTNSNPARYRETFAHGESSTGRSA